MRYEGEPMAQINWKYYPNDTDQFRWVLRTFGWIQMRYESEPMAQINWSYYLLAGSRWGMRVNPWLKLIENITLAALRSFAEFHGLLAGCRWGMRVNPWLKLIGHIFVEFYGFVEFHGLLAASRWGMRVNPWLKLIVNITLAILRSFAQFYGLLAGSRWGMRVNPWLKLTENITLAIAFFIWSSYMTKRTIVYAIYLYISAFYMFLGTDTSKNYDSIIIFHEVMNL